MNDREKKRGEWVLRENANKKKTKYEAEKENRKEKRMIRRRKGEKRTRDYAN